MVILVIGGYQWLSEVISVVENNFIHFKVMVIMVIDGYLWLLMVITVYLKRTMVFLVIGGYQWLSVVTSGVVENNFLHFKTIVTIYDWRQSSPGCRASPSTKHCRFCSSSLQRSFFCVP